MNLGSFSLSLAVKDVDKSLSFYEKLGFRVIDGGHINAGFIDTETIKWRILEHGSVKIGIFQGMFEKNMLSFNPEDVLGLQKDLKNAGIVFQQEAVENAPDGFISATLEDPDGNIIMFDQM